MVSNEKVIKALAELGIDVAPKNQSPQIKQLADRLKEYEKEMGDKLDPSTLNKYLK